MESTLTYSLKTSPSPINIITFRDKGARFSLAYGELADGTFSAAHNGWRSE
jgi:hypothetical protein